MLINYFNSFNLGSVRCDPQPNARINNEIHEFNALKVGKDVTSLFLG